MKSLKKFMTASMIIALVMTTSTFSSCKKSNSDSGNIGEATVSPKHPITISMFCGSSTISAATANNKIYKKIKDELGISFKIELLTGDLNQKLGVMIASGELPDVVNYNSELQAADDLIPLENKVKKYAPNIYEHYTQGNVWNMMKDSNDGHTYYLTSLGVINKNTAKTYYSGPAFWIQKQVLAEAGYPKVTTLDQYFKLIQDWVAKHPVIDGMSTIGFETLVTPAQSFVLENAPEHLSGHPNDGGVIVDNGIASLFQDKDISKIYYNKLNEMYNIGIIDRESITQNQDQYLQKIATGRVVGMFDQHWDFQSGESVLKKDKKYGETYAPLALTYEGVTPHYLDSPIPNLTNGFSITKNCKDPDRVLVALDKLMDEKWQKILNWGIEGEDYSMDTSTNQPVWTEQQQTNQNDSAWKAANKAEALYSWLPKIEGEYSDGNATTLGDNSVQYKKGLSAYDKNFYAKYNVNSEYEMMGEATKNEIYYPCWNINIPSNSAASSASTAINDTEIKWLPRIISGKSSDFDRQWSDYVAEIEKDNPKAYLDAINEGIQYRIKNWDMKK